MTEQATVTEQPRQASEKLRPPNAIFLRFHERLEPEFAAISRFQSLDAGEEIATRLP